MGRLKIKGKLQRSRQLRIIMGMQQRKEPEITKFCCGVVQNQENTAECRGGTIMMCVNSQSCPTLGTPGTAALQALLAVGFSRQEHWSELPCPPPGVLPNPGIKPGSPTL